MSTAARQPGGRGISVARDQQQGTRPPPHDLDAERAVIGAALLSPQSADTARQTVRSADFYHPSHQAVWSAIDKLRAAGKPVDSVTVAAEPDCPISAGELAAYMPDAPSSASAAVYAGIVADKARRRQVLADTLDIREAIEAGADWTVPAGRLHESATKSAAPGLAPVDWETFWSVDGPEKDWLVEPILPRGRQVATYSRAKTGKSLLALEVAAALATGRPVLGHHTHDPTNVVYLDLEMTPDDLRERLLDLGYTPNHDMSLLHYYQLVDLPPLDTAQGGAQVVGLAKRHQADLVVIDTMARAVEGEENSSDTYRDYDRHTGRRLKALGVTVWRLDHEGKNGTQGQRGSSSKDDDVDVVFRLTASDTNVTLTRTRSRISWIPATVTLTRRDTPLRHDLDPEAVPAGTVEAMRLLDQHQVPSDASANQALVILRAVGKGRRKDVVLAALRHRQNQVRTRSPNPEPPPGTTPGTAPANDNP